MAAEVAGVTNSASPKKPSMGVPMRTESSSAVGRYIEKGWAHPRRKEKGGRRYEDQNNLFWENEETKSVWQTGE